MANIFQDIGRSNALQVGQGIFKDVMATGQMERQGLMDAVTMKNQERTLAIQEAEAARKQKQWEDDHSIEYLDNFRTEAEKKGHGPAYKVLQEQLSPMVQVDRDGREYVIRKDRKAVAEKLATDPHLRWKVMTAEIQGYQDKAEEFGNKFDSLKKKLEENPDATLEEQKKWSMDAQAAFEAKKKLDDVIKQKTNTRNWADPEIAKTMVSAAEKDKDRSMTLRKEEETERANRAREAATDRRLDIMETTARAALAKAAEGQKLSFADKEAIRGMGKQLPKSKIAAETAVKNIQKIDRMIALIDSGAGGVRGELLAKINKIADIMRVTSPDDAKYNTLKSELRGFAGQLRLQLGLIGQTSDRDVAIMYEAAGGNTPAESQRAIINGYRQGYMQDINSYNSDAEAYSQYSGVGGSLYKPISVGGVGSSGGSGGGNPPPAAQIAPAGTKATLPDGRVVTSDGKGGWK